MLHSVCGITIHALVWALFSFSNYFSFFLKKNLNTSKALVFFGDGGLYSWLGSLLPLLEGMLVWGLGIVVFF